MTLNHFVRLAILIGLSSLPLCADEPGPDAQWGLKPVRCEGAYPSHLQGVCIDQQDAIFWSFTDVLVKTDRRGRVLKRIDVANHHGDLCYHEGKIYVAVNLGEFNQPAGRADSWIYVYDAETLDEIARHAVPQVVHGAGGVAYGDRRFVVVGGLPPGVNRNYLYEYDGSWTFLERHVLDSGHTLLGIQTAEYAAGTWWFGCYGNPPQLLNSAEDFTLAGKWSFNASLGIVNVGKDRFLVARNTRKPGEGYVGELRPAVVDPQGGPRLAE